MDTFKVKGRIVFDPPNMTRKHDRQSSWKRIAMLVFNCDMDHYYSWFINKRYNLKLNAPLRGPHITFINDRWFGEDSEWNEIKKEFDGKEIEVELNPDVRSDGKHWWLVVDENSRKPLHNIRIKLGFTERPHFGLHMSAGFANEKNIDHSRYILTCIQKGYITT